VKSFSVIFPRRKAGQSSRGPAQPVIVTMSLLKVGVNPVFSPCALRWGCIPVPLPGKLASHTLLFMCNRITSPIDNLSSLSALRQELSHLPLATAADKLKVSPTAIKKACRKLGVFRWPMKFPSGNNAPDLSLSKTKQRTGPPTGRVAAPKSPWSPPPKSSSSEAERAQDAHSKQLNRARTAMQQAPRPALSASAPSEPPSQPAAKKKSDKKKAVMVPGSRSKGAPRRAASNSKASASAARIEDGRRTVPVKVPQSTIRAWGAAGHGDGGIGALQSAHARALLAQNQYAQSRASPFAGEEVVEPLELMKQGIPISNEQFEYLTSLQLPTYSEQQQHQQHQQQMMMMMKEKRTWLDDSFKWQYPAGTFPASNQISLQSCTVGQEVNAASNHAPLRQSRRPPALSTSLFTSFVADMAVSAAENAGHTWAHVPGTCRSTTSSLSQAPTMHTMGSSCCSSTIDSGSSSPSCKEGSPGTLSHSQSTSSMAGAKSLGEDELPDSSTPYTLGEGGEAAFSMMQDGCGSISSLPTTIGNSIPPDFCIFKASSSASSPKMSRQGSFSCFDFLGLTPRGSDDFAMRESDGLGQPFLNWPSCLLGPAC
jgi:hypothetical protein